MESNLDDHRPGLNPPRFSLASLFFGVAVLGVLFAAITYLGTYATLLVILFVLTIAAHVAGNSLGTQLRDNGDKPQIVDGPSPQKRRRSGANDFAPPSQLHQRSTLGKPIFITTGVGIVAGAALGGYGLVSLMEHPTIVTIAFGITASGVLGGIWTFAASSFLHVTSGAIRQASRGTKSP